LILCLLKTAEKEATRLHSVCSDIHGIQFELNRSKTSHTHTHTQAKQKKKKAKHIFTELWSSEKARSGQSA